MADDHHERRGGTRVEIAGRLRGEITVVQPVAILDISRSGALIETQVPLQLNSLHDLRLVLGGLSVIVKARVAHCHIEDGGHNVTAYLAGIEFVDLAAPAAAAIGAFLDDVTSQTR